MFKQSEFMRWLGLSNRAPLVMGILNVTPDSFSDGGRYMAPEEALRHAREMIQAGADVIDLGAESTRPGSERVPAAEQIARLGPILYRLSELGPAAWSIDTTIRAVAEYALNHGVGMINDISGGLEDPGILDLAADRGCPIILMHKKGDPKTMQDRPVYQDLNGELMAFFEERLEKAGEKGIWENVLIDPGVGFGKTTEDNLEIIRSVGRYKTLGRPVVVGVSRKRFIGEILNQPRAEDRMVGSVAAGVCAVLNGADVLRVHDVRETAWAVEMVRKIRG